MNDEAGFERLYVTASDGLSLFGRDYRPPRPDFTPVVCLPGLTRNSADFHELASFLSQHHETPRRVIALDYRGRGESGYDSDWKKYDPRVEAQDALDFLTAVGVHEAIFVGTSRGGLIIYALAVMRPALLRGAVLNDIGAVVEIEGLKRIRSYVGKLPPPRTYDEAAEILQKITGGQFVGFSQAEWLRNARRTFAEKNGKLAPRYDLSLMKGLALIDLEKPLPDLWPLFMGLRDFPVLVLRGANSDLLSAATVAEMTMRHPNCAAVEVANEGHAPLLADQPTLCAIEAFCARAEARPREPLAAAETSSA
ncbi:MAG: alpha/beta hydrolase [Beijerinckiaceae bacterium]